MIGKLTVLLYIDLVGFYLHSVWSPSAVGSEIRVACTESPRPTDQ